MMSVIAALLVVIIVGVFVSGVTREGRKAQQKKARSVLEYAGIRRPEPEKDDEP